jgi:glycosyltransferase involved in cell wall biosynthesis
VTLDLIVPTWNEEGWLPPLLDRVSAIGHIDQVIIADNHSTDATRTVAELYGTVIVDGGLPARARNAGASESRAEYLVFADADAVFNQTHIDTVIRVFRSSDTVGVHFRLQPLSGTRFVRVCYSVLAALIRAFRALGVPQGTGSFIAVRRDAFKKIGGFDESLVAGEDSDFLRRLGREGRVIFITDRPVGVSSRRFEIEQPFLFALKTLFWGALRLVGRGEGTMPYRWAIYPRGLAERDASDARRFLKKFDQ